MNLETYETQIDAIGQEAVQQTLNALGIGSSNQTGASAAGPGSSLSTATQAGGGSGGASIDLSATNALLERIAAAVERDQPQQSQPVY